MIRNLSNASAYSDSKGIFAARKAIMQYCQEKGIQGVALEMFIPAMVFLSTSFYL